MKAHLIDTHLLVPRSRSSAKVKVKYQGHVSQKMGVSGALSVSQTHLVSLENGTRAFSESKDRDQTADNLLSDHGCE